MAGITYKYELNSKPNKQGLHSILLRVTHEKKLTRFSTGVYVKEKNFKKNGSASNADWVRRAEPIHATYNEQLLSFLQEIRSIVLTLEKQGRVTSGANIKSYIKEQKALQKETEVAKELDSFTAYFKGSLEHFKSKYKWSNYIQFKSVFNLLGGFVKEVRDGNDLKFIDIDVAFLNEFEKWLLDGGNSDGSDAKRPRLPNTVQTKFKKLRRVVYRAISEGKIAMTNNPFLFWSTSGNKVSRAKLTLSEIQGIQNFEFVEGSLIEESRNAFLFSFYCAGIRVSDMMNMTWGNVKGGRLDYVMDKTKKPVNIVLISEAKLILESLARQSKDDSERLFKFLDRVKEPKAASVDEAKYKKLNSATTLYNKYLKSIAKKVGIEKEISSHIARHSFADFARRKGVVLTDIQKMLGHTKLAVTEAYFAQDDVESTDEALLAMSFS